MDRICCVATMAFLVAFALCFSIATTGNAQSTAEIEQKIKALEEARKAGILNDEEFNRKKEELLGKGATPKAPSAQEKGKTYRHPVGFTFWYPESWTLKDGDEYLQLVPPNPGANADGPTEAYLAVADDISQSGIKNPDDPQVIEAINARVLSFLPFVQRTDKVVAIATTAGKGAMFEWKGRNPRGNEVVARCFVGIVKQYAISLFAVGIKDQVEKRDADLRKMFASCGMEEGKTDPKLVGNWSLLSTTSLTNNSINENAWSRARSVTDTQSVYAFAADGTLSLIGEDNSWGSHKYQVIEGGQGRQLRVVSGSTGEIYGETR